MEASREPLLDRSFSQPSAGSSEELNSEAVNLKLQAESIVDRCFLINLDRRQDRLSEWLAQVPSLGRFRHLSGLRQSMVATSRRHRSGALATGLGMLPLTLIHSRKVFN